MLALRSTDRATRSGRFVVAISQNSVWFFQYLIALNVLYQDVNALLYSGVYDIEVLL